MAGPGDLERLVARPDERHAGEVGADGEDERLAGDGDGDDLARHGALTQALDGGRETGDRLRAEGVGLGVVEAVVEGDEREGAAATREGDVVHGVRVTTSEAKSLAAVGFSVVVALTWRSPLRSCGSSRTRRPRGAGSPR